MAITGTPIWPLFSIISLRFCASNATLYSVYAILFSSKNSFAALQYEHVGVLYITSFLHMHLKYLC